MRIVVSLAALVVLSAPAGADLITKPLSANPRPAPTAPGPTGSGPGGYRVRAQPTTPGDIIEAPPQAALKTAPPSAASVADIPADDPADRPADSDPRKLIGAIALVIGVYATTRLLRGRPKASEP